MSRSPRLREEAVTTPTQALTQVQAVALAQALTQVQAVALAQAQEVTPEVRTTTSRTRALRGS